MVEDDALQNLQELTSRIAKLTTLYEAGKVNKLELGRRLRSHALDAG